MKYKVVVIDDEPWVRDVIKSLGDWEAYDMCVIGEASDGLSALELVSHVLPDVIITDIKMPGLNGLEFLAELGKRNLSAKTIVITGYDDFSYIREALKLHVTDYLLKPVKPEELNEQLALCAQQLGERQPAGSGFTYDACAFMSVGWFGRYSDIREQIISCLLAQDKTLIGVKFKQLISIIKSSGEDVSVRLMICIYYDLMHSLEKFIASNGYTVEEALSQHDVTYVFRNDTDIGDMLGVIASFYEQSAISLERLKKSRSRVDMKKIKEYVDLSFTEGITLEQVAGMFFLSKEYLSKVFKEYAGQSFSDYVTDKRMQKAKSLICEYNIPIKDVGTLVGYLDQAHFYKTFKKQFGKTPGEVQRNGL